MKNKDDKKSFQSKEVLNKDFFKVTDLDNPSHILEAIKADADNIPLPEEPWKILIASGCGCGCAGDGGCGGDGGGGGDGGDGGGAGGK